MASVTTKLRAENKSYEIEYKALKELEKRTLHKDVAFLFRVSKSTLSTWKGTKTKFLKKYKNDLISKREKPEKYEELNKAMHKWFLILQIENVPISGPILKKKALEFKLLRDG